MGVEGRGREGNGGEERTGQDRAGHGRAEQRPISRNTSLWRKSTCAISYCVSCAITLGPISRKLRTIGIRRKSAAYAIKCGATYATYLGGVSGCFMS